MDELIDNEFVAVCDALLGIRAISSPSWRKVLTTGVHDSIARGDLYSHAVSSSDMTIVKKLEAFESKDFDGLLLKVSKYWQQSPEILNPNLRDEPSL